MKLYKNVLHHRGNTLPKWYLETIGLYVSMINKCKYCIEHHFKGLKHLLNEDGKADKIRVGMVNGSVEEVLDKKFASGLNYAEKLSQSPPHVSKTDVEKLKKAGFTNGQILEINQASSYFAYANRTVLGFGVDTRGYILGLSPGDSDDPGTWSHA